MWKPKGMYLDDWREKHPAAGLKADHEGSRAAQIRAFCCECMQATSASDCPNTACPLFPSRPGADHEGANRRTADSVPSVGQYQAWILARDPDGLKAEAARVRFGHRAKGDDGDGEYQEV